VSAYNYLSGLLRMKSERNYASIGRQTGASGQGVQHFMSNSPWSAQAAIRQVQQEIAGKPEFQRGGMLLLDESADEKASEKTVGAGRQHNGRLGKIEMSQVGTFLAYVNGETWTWVDGELFLQEHWFSPQMVKERKRLGVPAERRSESKVELGWEMIQRAVAHGLPFEAVGCDDLYGRAEWFRREMDRAGIVYMADVPENIQVYLSEPQVGVPATAPGHRGKPFTRERVLPEEESLSVETVARREDTRYQRIRVRPTERGELADEFAARRVWTIREGEVLQEWLVIRRAGDGAMSYSLSNAPADSTLDRLAWLKCQRYFVERANQDSKSEIGWDELRAQKYRAWEHHLAMTILATWYIAETKLDWAKQYPRDPQLAQQFEADVLPALSVANVRELLRAAMPLPQLTPDDAIGLVVEHLVNRTRARKSRMKSKQHLDTS
jgi:SRSO17 transposase